MTKVKRGQLPYINKGQGCSISGCEDSAFCKTFCSKHYSRFIKTGDPLKTPLNRPHGRRNVCTIEKCIGIVEGYSYCSKHYKKFRKYGDPLAGRPQGVGKYNKEGYVLIKRPNWESSRKDGYVLEHRYVMEKELGRMLRKDEIIHHKNGIRDDNRLNNLERMTIKTHYKGSSPIICPHCNK